MSVLRTKFWMGWLGMLALCPFANAGSIGSGFTYQGQLKEGGVPVNDTCDMRFNLRTNPWGTDNTDVVGTILFDGSVTGFPSMAIQDGLFQVELDFGTDALAQSPVWLDVSVRCPAGSGGTYIGLLPRQPVNAAPYAVHTRGISVDSTGNVGIGTDAPAERLHVTGNIQADKVTVGDTLTNGSGVTIRHTELQVFPNPPVQREAEMAYDGTRLSLYTDTTSSPPHPANGLVIDNLGRVGIGTDTLSGQLTVNGMIESLSLGFKFPDGTVQSTAASGGGSLWSAKGNDIYYSGGKVGLGTNSPKQRLHNTGDYYGRGHLWLYAYQGDGKDGTAYVQARDDSGASSIGMKLRTQNAGSLVDALSLHPMGGVGIGTSPPPTGLWVKGYGAPGFGGQIVIDSSDTSGVLDSGASLLFTSMASLPSTHLGSIGCFKEDGDKARSAYYLSLKTRSNNSIPNEKVRITSTGDVGIGTTTPAGHLALGDYFSGTGFSKVVNYKKQLVIGGDYNVDTNTGNSVKLLITTYDNDSLSDIYPIYAEDENNGVDFYVRNHEGVRTAYFAGRLGIGTSPVLFDTRYRLNVTSDGVGNPDDWTAHFKDSNGTGEVWLAGDDGYGHDYGIETRGGKAGGFFHDTDTQAEARVAYTSGTGKKYGIWAKGRGASAEGAGGHFEDELGDSATLATGGWGVWGYGIGGGGHMEDIGSGAYARLGFSGFSIWGNGTKNFVQNHPEQKNRVVVYAAPEGDEVATYTRGTARLVNGEARVPLGETFQWVTNPDIGLTAHVTLRGDCNGLYVVSVTTTELVVRELNSGTSNTKFDFIVYGLRIGFEEAAVVQEKELPAPIPSMASLKQQYVAHPELRKFNAMERFKRMRTETGSRGLLDLSAARALHDAITEYDPANHNQTAVHDRMPLSRQPGSVTRSDAEVQQH